MTTGERSGTPPEPVIDPGQPIIDAHHHLFERPGHRYLLGDFAQDLASGHDVRASIFVQARAAYRTEGPEALRPVGETEFALAIAQDARRRDPAARICAAVIAFADLELGADVRPVLEAHLSAGGGYVRGIRHIVSWDADPALLNDAYPTTESMLDDRSFRTGFAELAPLGLSFDAWLLFPQIPRLTALARAFPETRIILDHCGGIVGTRGYAGRTDEIYRVWSHLIGELAACENVSVKLGGLGMPLSGFGFESRDRSPSSDELAARWRPWMERCIEAFGASRCMFESNFPHDRASTDYRTLWNALKRIAAGASEDERADLFWRTASRVYRLDPNGFPGSCCGKVESGFPETARFRT